MTSKNIQRNTKALKQISNKAYSGIKSKVNNIVNLYSDRSIAQFSTAKKIITDLINADTDKEKKKANKQYDKVANKSNEPLNVRMALNKLTKTGWVGARNSIKKQKGNKNEFIITYYFYRTTGVGKPAFKHEGISYYSTTHQPNQAIAIATSIISKYIKDVMEKRIGNKIFYKTEPTVFDRFVSIISTSDDVKRLFEVYPEDYISALKIIGIDEVKKDKDYSPTTENLRDVAHISMYDRYIKTEMDIKYNTFKTAIKHNNYNKYPCLFQALHDHYDGTLINNPIKRMPLTLESVSKFCGKTVNEFKNHGASLEEMKNVFITYKIPARIFDCVGNCVFKYDPERSNWHTKPFICKIKNSHIYTMNHDLQSIKQKVNNDEKKITIYASKDFHINKHEQPVECKVIDTIDDFLKLREHEEYNLIQRANNLVKKNL